MLLMCIIHALQHRSFIEKECPIPIWPRPDRKNPTSGLILVISRLHMPLPKSASVGARATDVYSETCPLVLKLISKPPAQIDPELIEEVLSYLPFLRQLVTCCACAGIADESMTSLSCGHCYCYQCQFREPLLKIQCRQCRERKGLVCENQLRTIVQLYRELVTLLSIHFKDTEVKEPLAEMIREVLHGEKVSRSVLMIPPPPQYLSTPKQVTIVTKKTQQKAVPLPSTKKKGKAKKKLVLEEAETTEEEEEHDEPSDNDSTQSEKETGDKEESKTSHIVSVSTDLIKTKQVKVSRKRSSQRTSTPQMQYSCRCGTNPGVTFGGRICARKKCACYINEAPCTRCRCKGCCNPYNNSCT